MATAAVTYTFAPATTIESAQANTNFNDLVSFLNASVMHRDASAAFTAVPSGPSTDPSSANHLTRKSYVDAADLLRAKDPKTSGTQAGLVGTMTHGTHQLLVQGGTATDTTSVAGGIAVSFPAAFPNGVLTVLVTQGNSAVGGGDVVAVDFSSVSVSGFTVRFYDDDGSVIASASRRCNWIALGW